MRFQLETWCESLKTTKSTHVTVIQDTRSILRRSENIRNLDAFLGFRFYRGASLSQLSRSPWPKRTTYICRHASRLEDARWESLRTATRGLPFWRQGQCDDSPLHAMRGGARTLRVLATGAGLPAWRCALIKNRSLEMRPNMAFFQKPVKYHCNACGFSSLTICLRFLIETLALKLLIKTLISKIIYPNILLLTLIVLSNKLQR